MRALANMRVIGRACGVRVNQCTCVHECECVCACMRGCVYVHVLDNQTNTSQWLNRIATQGAYRLRQRRIEEKQAPGPNAHTYYSDLRHVAANS